MKNKPLQKTKDDLVEELEHRLFAWLVQLTTQQVTSSESPVRVYPSNLALLQLKCR